MCGIVGYIGAKPASNYLLEGLFRLEYRGYDSAGIAVQSGDTIAVRKKTGRVGQLAELLKASPVTGTHGIGHTRWATHGQPSDNNSHPHTGGNGEVVLVHNGVIENYATLRSQLQELGYVFHSQTDTEVVAHLVAHQLEEELKLGADPDSNATYLRAVELTLKQLKGTYGLGVLFRDKPGLLIAARLGSPLVVGVGKDEHYLASDASPLVGYTDKVVYLNDHEIAMITANSLEILHRDTGSQTPHIRVLEQTASDTELGQFEHYMLKEIFEQPTSIENAFRGRLDDDEATARFGGLNLDPQELRRIDRIVLTACGTSWHAGLVGEYIIEEFARIPVEVEYASELRYRNPPMSERTMVFAITQSGETADTLAAMRECKRKGHPTLAICNVVGSSIAREADGGIYLHAGPEVGVASTKAFTSQVTVLTLLALFMGRIRHLSYPAGQRMIANLRKMPDKIRQTLECHNRVKEIARKYYTAENFLYLGRLHNFPVALEGALKLKEISYIHAEGYPAAEMKHGPIALVDEQTPSVFVVPRCQIYPKVISNMEEVRARRGPIIAIACEGDDKVAELADDVIYVPDVDEYLQPMVTSVPLQLLAYEIALLRGCNVDRPRNLAKSVTVE
ncbi:glucosamine/fructose-6-phosphate aminotransferase, isomerizing [Planctopirus limnophila DSM 3776]|uniref:Glutamine--fructose-6-phosphate aminotransferase [isomerizing] n=1 Tax=Planctopirus limnophila (strain ATCC 43296 / DSM 3776 / IFAM 1008 / Mu 290) TaxID=521674 RepID=D5SVA6_PLAL2|nr:glutamine--fructose-6-phosphate transaminase (isomerizing) [Planctopirus limnophila]ADG67176.1 glucosamine/fructose-6-phosphate aminotransferase, isomerizing [Planctopirus limnophila DSM 3776]